MESGELSKLLEKYHGKMFMIDNGTSLVLGGLRQPSCEHHSDGCDVALTTGLWRFTSGGWDGRHSQAINLEDYDWDNFEEERGGIRANRDLDTGVTETLYIGEELVEHYARRGVGEGVLIPGID